MGLDWPHKWLATPPFVRYGVFMTLRAYTPPAITDLGSLTTLTQGTLSGNVLDFGIPANLPAPGGPPSGFPILS